MIEQKAKTDELRKFLGEVYNDEEYEEGFSKVKDDDLAFASDNLYGGVHWLAVMPPEQPGGPDVVLTSTASEAPILTRAMIAAVQRQRDYRPRKPSKP